MRRRGEFTAIVSRPYREERSDSVHGDICEGRAEGDPTKVLWQLMMLRVFRSCISKDLACAQAILLYMECARGIGDCIDDKMT